MTIRKKNYESKPVIDLTGPDGNAYVLMGMAADYVKTLAKADITLHPESWADTPEELRFYDIDVILADMQSSDYDHLVKVFDFWFGEYVILETS